MSTTMTEDNGLIVHVESTELGAYCKCCGQSITKYHSLNKTVTLNHLSTFGTPVFIKFQPKRYECIKCKSTTTQKPSWYQSTGHCTQSYAQYILDLVVNSTIHDVTKQEGLSYKRIMNIIKKYAPNEIDWSSIEEIRDLGIDEIALKKGHKDFVVIISTKKKKSCRSRCFKEPKEEDGKRFFIDHSQ
jgi:transposase